MKPVKHRFKLCLAFLLCFGLMMGFMSVTAYAETIDPVAYVNSAGEDMGEQNCIHINGNVTT